MMGPPQERGPEEEMAEDRLILVVDDDADFLEYVRIVLEANGYRVRTASGVDNALAQMRAQCPDLVIVDVMMSYVLDGWYMGRQMRSDPALCHVPIVMVSAVVSTEDDSLFPESSEVFHDAFLTKPLAPERLLTIVSDLLPPDDEKRGVA